MDIAALIGVVTIVYLIVLNGYLNGSMKTRIDAVLSVLWLALLALAFIAFGWKNRPYRNRGFWSLAFGFCALPQGASTAALIFSHPPRSTPNHR